MSKVAVVILNWNGEALLKEFLPALISCTTGTSVPQTIETPFSTTLYVADNGSTDTSLELLHREFPSVKVFSFDENYGFAKGYNIALDLIKADYYVLLNSDVRVTQGWLDPLIANLEQNPDVAAVQGKIRKEGDERFFEYAGAAGGLLDRNCYPYCRGRSKIRGRAEEDRGQYDTPSEIDWASGACFAIRAEAWHAQGGFDESFFAHQEEIDLCWRLRLAGYKILYTPQSVVYHVGGASLSQGDPYKLYLNFRNNRKMMLKCLPQQVGPRKAKCILARRKFLDWSVALAYLFTFRYKYFKAVKDAYRDLKQL